MDVQALFTKLKTKYPQSGLSDSEILGIATGLFATGLVTDDNVDKIVDSQDSSMRSFQSLFDSRFSSKKDALTKDLTKTLTEQNEKAFMEKYHIGADDKQVVKAEPKTEDEKLLAKVAELMDKKMDDKFKPFLDKFKAEETKHEEAVRTANILASAKKAGIKEELAKMLNVPGDVTDLDSYMKDKAQQLANLGFSPSVEPAGGSSHEDNDGKAIAAQIRAGAPKKEEK